ncbi:MAG TPA: 30S ribosomal protein S18 [candidate division Zixibacteria bacterium]|jgi:small subunit ribosomal protein S18|nr:30S ribosomal protein S18 [candidate division Zixibacteria bacterium]
MIKRNKPTGPRERRPSYRKVCKFCMEKAEDINYRDDKKLRHFMTERGKIVPRRVSGNCARHQRLLSVAIKRARHLALLPFISEHR